MAQTWLAKYGTYEETVTGSATGITAYAGGGQANATALTAKYNSIDTCATDLDSVKLVSGGIGKIQYVFNNTSKIVAVYPQSSSYINGIQNVAFWLKPSKTAKFGAVTSTKYIATIEEPYKKWTGLMLQSGTSAPTARVLENTLGGTITWGYTSTGVYTATLTGTFTVDKTFFIFHNSVLDQRTTVYRSSANVFTIEVFTHAGAAANDRLTDANLEVRVYS